MRVMAVVAPISYGFVLEYKRPVLGAVALVARFIFALKLRPAPFNNSALVRVVAVAAADLAFAQRMMMWQVELRFYIEVTLETGFRRSIRIKDRTGGSTAFHVLAARTMA